MISRASIAAASLLAAGLLGAAPAAAGGDAVPAKRIAKPVPPVQWTLTIENAGGLVYGEEKGGVREGVYYLGGHASFLFGRKKGGKWAGGISAETGSFDMRTFVAGAGVALLIPVHEIAPLILEVFPLYLRGRGKNGMSVGGRLWWGVHSFNMHATEVATAGIFMMVQRGVVGVREGDWLMTWGIDFSLHVLAIPFGMAWQAMLRK